MTLSTTAALVDAAVEQRSAVLGFNVILLEHAEAIADGATRAGAGVLLQVSENAIRYHEGRARPLLAACAEIAASAGVPIAVHLDHIEDLDLAGELVAATDLGIGSIMIDAARLPTDDNVRVTRDIAARARVANLWVEAELGRTGGKEGAHTPDVRTDPQEAEWFVEQTGVDGLAVAVGSSHAMTDRTAEAPGRMSWGRTRLRSSLHHRLHCDDDLQDVEVLTELMHELSVGDPARARGSAAGRFALRRPRRPPRPRRRARSAPAGRATGS